MSRDITVLPFRQPEAIDDRRPPRKGRAEPLAGRDHATDGGMAGRL